MRAYLTILVLGAVLAGCGGGSLSPANVAPEPGGAVAVSFTRTFPPGFWAQGDHAYRLVVECPTQRFTPPIVRFEVSEEADEVGTAYLRFDGPGRRVLSPADLSAVHPEDTTVATLTVAGMTETDAEEALTDCRASVIYDGLDPEPLEPGAPFRP
ncbi:MAG: hypothetical protein WEA76_05595 [Acidimicrobiia bacterium]